jgi:hypothetical protein
MPTTATAPARRTHQLQPEVPRGKLEIADRGAEINQLRPLDLPWAVSPPARERMRGRGATHPAGAGAVAAGRRAVSLLPDDGGGVDRARGEHLSELGVRPRHAPHGAAVRLQHPR